jgi:hypothetical protein
MSTRRQKGFTKNREWPTEDNAKLKNTKTEITYERLQVLAVVLTLMQIKVFWDITPYIMVVIEISRKYSEDEGTPPKLYNYLPIDMAS